MKRTHPNRLIGSNSACGMPQTQTFVHLIILLFPRARLTPLRTPAFEINSCQHAPEDSNRYSANCRLAARFCRQSQAPGLIRPKSEMPVCSRLRKSTQARFQRDRGRGAYEIVRLENHPPSPCSRLCPGDLFVPVISIVVPCPKPRTVATDRPGRTGTNRGPTGRNCAQPGELGRQCDLSCRSSAGGGHGGHFLFPRARRRSMGGNSGRIAGDLRSYPADRVLDSERYGGRAVGTLITECSGNDAASNHRRSVDTAIRHGSSGRYLHDGAGWNRIAAGRRSELPGGRKGPAMGPVVGNSVDDSAVALLVCGAGYRHACARRRHQQFVGREFANELQRFCFERRGCPVDSRARRFLRAEGGARCGRGEQPARFDRLRHFFAVCVRASPAFPELEQRLTVRNHGHADCSLELSRGNDPAGSSRIGDCGSDFQLCAPSAFHAAGRIGSCVLERFGHLEAGPGDGRLMRSGGYPVNLSNGLLNLTNWLGNVIMPTMAGLFAAAAIYRFSKAQPYQHLGYAALASLMCSGLLRAMESFRNQASWNNPDRYWISILTLVNWVGNVLLPLYGAGQVVLAVVHFAGLLERMTRS